MSKETGIAVPSRRLLGWSALLLACVLSVTLSGSCDSGEGASDGGRCTSQTDCGPEETCLGGVCTARRASATDSGRDETQPSDIAAGDPGRDEADGPVTADADDNDVIDWGTWDLLEDTGGGLTQWGELDVQPADLVLELATGTSRTVDYRVIDPAGTDVTSSAVFSIEAPDLGTFSGRTLTTSTTRGGAARVWAAVGEMNGATRITVVRPEVERAVRGAPANAAALFTGPEDAARAPTIVYPEDGTIVPPNLPSFEVHFLPGAGNDLFEVTFAGPTSVVRTFTGCASIGGGCVLMLDPLSMSEVAVAARAAGWVRIGIRGTSSTGGGSFGSAETRRLGVAGDWIEGGVYWWAATSGNIVRYDFGGAAARVETFMGGSLFNCVGCHTLSRDGQRIAVGRGIPGPARSSLLDVPTQDTLGSAFGANFYTFSPDGTRLLVSDGVRLTLRDGSTGATVPGLSATTGGSMPDWSADGGRVVFSVPLGVAPPFGGAPGHDAPANLAILAYDGAAFGAAADTLVAASGENNYYPSFSPDGLWVLFNRSTRNSYNAIDARLWLVDSDGTGSPVELAAANGEGMLGNTWPKWAPFARTFRGETIFWITFTSRRDYGLRLAQQSRPEEERVSQLWMAAVRPGDLPGDPSAPAFWLPVQGLTSGNHIAQWAESVPRLICVTDDDCTAGQECWKGWCVSPP